VETEVDLDRDVPEPIEVGKFKIPEDSYFTPMEGEA